MNERCRICFRKFTQGIFTLLERSSKDSTVCHGCWNAGSDQSDAKSLDVPNSVPQDTTLSGEVDRLLSALSPNVPTQITPQGGKHSQTGTAFHHLPAALMLKLAAILHEGGAKYGRDNWKNISVEDHINHALTHIFGEASGDTQDDHLEHAILRLIFAATVKKEGGQYRAAS